MVEVKEDWKNQNLLLFQDACAFVENVPQGKRYTDNSESKMAQNVWIRMRILKNVPQGLEQQVV